MFVTKGKLCNNYEMAKLINEKWKNSSFQKKKSLVGSTPVSFLVLVLSSLLRTRYLRQKLGLILHSDNKILITFAERSKIAPTNSKSPISDDS